MADTPQAASASTLKPTATSDALPQRRSNFATLGDALDYAAQGQKGFNFHDARADLVRAYPFRNSPPMPAATPRTSLPKACSPVTASP